MAITNHERVGTALELLKAGLDPFIQREVHESGSMPSSGLCGGQLGSTGKLFLIERLQRSPLSVTGVDAAMQSSA